MAKRFKFLGRRWQVAELDAVAYGVVLAAILVVAAIASVVSLFSN